MDSKEKDLELKLKDYDRFIVTLIIISCYFYMGSIIFTYIKPSSEGSKMFILTFTSMLVTFWLLLKYNHIQQLLENELDQS